MSRRKTTTPPLPNNEWTENQVRDLLCLYREQPCLWKTDDPAYLDYEERRLAYETIRQEINREDVELVEVMFKIREIRRIFAREKRHLASTNFDCEPGIQWFDFLDKFLSKYLSFDEIESVEELTKGSNACSGNYEPDNLSSDLISPSKTSFCVPSTCRIKNKNSNSTITWEKKVSCRCNSFSTKAQCKAMNNEIEKRNTSKSEPIVFAINSAQILQMPKGRKRDEESISSQRSKQTTQRSYEYHLFSEKVARRLKQMKPKEATRTQKAIENLLMNVESNADFVTSRSWSSSSIHNEMDSRNSQTFTVQEFSKNQSCNSFTSSMYS